MASNDILSHGPADPTYIIELAQRVMADADHNVTDLIYLYQSALLAVAIADETSQEMQDTLQAIVDDIWERAEAGDEHAQLAAKAYGHLSDPDAGAASIRIAETALQLLLMLPLVRDALLTGEDHETVVDMLDAIDEMISGPDLDMPDLTDEEMDKMLAELDEELGLESGKE